MGCDRATLAAAAPFGAAADGRFTECSAGDLLHTVDRLSVAGFAEGVPTLFNGSGLFLYLARHWQMAKDRHGFGPQGPSPTGTQAGGPRGYDAGKRVYGRKRHIVTDTNGLLLAVYVHPANVQDVHGAVPLLERLRSRFPKLRHVFTDRIYRGQQLANAVSHCGPWTIEVVERPPGVKGFQLLPRRWVVERTFAWFGRCRRLAKDFEGSAATETAWVLVAHLRLLTRRLATARNY
jgi:transposase